MGEPTPSLPLRGLARAAWRDFRAALTPLVLFEAAFKLLGGLLLLPAIAWVLGRLLAFAGRTAVTNDDILRFLLSPAGVLYAALLGLTLLAGWLLEHAGVMAVVVWSHCGGRAGLGFTLKAGASACVRVARLGLAILGAGIALLLPLLGLAALTYSLLLTDHDINFYLATRPPRFYVACGIGGVLLLAALLLAATLYVRWAFALPILLFEGRQPIAALRESARRARGVYLRLGGVLLGWQLLALVVAAGAVAGFGLLSSGFLAAAGSRPSAIIPVVAGLLLLHGLLLALLSFVGVVGHCLLLLRLYVRRGSALGVSESEGWVAATCVQPPTPWLVRRWRWAIPAFAVGVLLLGLVVAGLADADERVEVTGHRGHSRAAPENSLSAIRAAIASGADYAEIDVQETKDGHIILLHDGDFKRIAGVAKKPAELTLAQVKELDVGRSFSPEFAGERVPTLKEVIAAARGRIKLNIELKFPGTDYRLAARVADLLHEEEFEDQCIVMSLDAIGVRQAKRHNPRLRTGAIVTVALGDISHLDVDVLSVNASRLSDDLLRAARRRHKDVHVWTVNDRRRARRLIERGVRNLITDDPDLLVPLREERQQLGSTERLLLSCRYLLQVDR
jgi:glycerophosphoryl diester phosphodiesterase